MRFSSLALTVFSLSAVLPACALASGDAAGTTTSAASMAKFEQAVDRAESLRLPLNKVLLYRQAAVALASTDKPQALALLRRGLADIDQAEAAMKAQKTLDERSYQQLEFHRLPVIMLMERVDPAEALSVLGPPQTADRDTAFQALFFERLKDPEMVRQAGLQKLSYGVTPAVVSAYEVLARHDAAAARTLATAIVLKLTATDPATDPAAVQSAFALLRLLRTDIGSLAPAMIVDSGRLSPNSYADLFSFIGDAFLDAKDPEMLILGERPDLYVAALEQYAPTKAEEVKLLAFAAPDAKSLIFSPEQPVVDTNHPDPATLTPEQQAQRAADKARVEAQMKDTDAETGLLLAKIKETKLSQKERDDAVFSVVDQANKALAQARSAPTVLDREAFRDGELELYNLGAITHVVDAASTILQTYAMDHPKVAEEAARTLDGEEVQTEVALQIAIREMTGAPAYLVPPAKPPLKPSPAADVKGPVISRTAAGEGSQ